MSTVSWDALAQQYGPQIAEYNAPPETEEPEAGEEREYRIRVSYSCSQLVTVRAKSEETAIDLASDKPPDQWGDEYEWYTQDATVWEEPR